MSERDDAVAARRLLQDAQEVPRRHFKGCGVSTGGHICSCERIAQQTSLMPLPDVTALIDSETDAMNAAQDAASAALDKHGYAKPFDPNVKITGIPGCGPIEFMSPQDAQAYRDLKAALATVKRLQTELAQAHERAQMYLKRIADMSDQTSGMG